MLSPKCFKPILKVADMSHIVIARQCDLWHGFFPSLRSNSLYVAPSRLQLSDVIYYWYSVVVCGIFKS